MADESADRGWARRLLGLPSFALGVVFLVASLPTPATRRARFDGWQWLAEPARWSAELDRVLPDYADLKTWIGYALIAYVGALVLVSVRHGRFDLLGIGLGVAVVATVCLHALALLGWLAYWVVSFAGTVIKAVFGALDAARSAVSGFLFDDWTWAAVLAVAIIGGGSALRFGPNWLKSTVFLLGVLVLVIGVLSLLGLAVKALAPDVSFPEVEAWVREVGAIVLVVIAVTTVGHLFWDQLTSTLQAGSDRLGVIMGAIAVGSTLALLMLVGNLGDAYDYYPDAVAEWAKSTVQSPDDPQFDASMTLVVVGLSAVGVMSNVVSIRPGPSLEKFRKSLIYSVLGVIAAGAIASIAKREN